MRRHLDNCPPCWTRWNRHRWDAAQGHPLLEQLASYLGPDFRPYFDSSRALADEWDRAAPRTPADVAAFYRASTSYLYNLVIWEASGNRPDYLSAAAPALQHVRARTVLDVGSGIGSDLLRLSGLGLQTMSCEYNGPSHRFARWRGTAATPHVEPDQLTRPPRRTSTGPPTDTGTAPTAGPATAATHDPFSAESVPSSGDGPDVLWIVDTLDHIEDVPGQLAPLLEQATLLVTEHLDHDRAHGRQRFHHRRRRADLEALLARHGLHPRPDEDAAGAPITCWTRP